MTTTAEQLKAVEEEMLEEIHEGVLPLMRQCSQCNCIFFIEKDGPDTWIDRFQPANADGHDCTCHGLGHIHWQEGN